MEDCIQNANVNDAELTPIPVAPWQSNATFSATETHSCNGRNGLHFAG
ncbi:hypothetical protein RMSM_03994 [Rhodopirellula maiorica SM1]|uniref:Uncharacterized protein n=1 Tax=Rhodopirellula maiorica SM1 TaxID=1265738 RepID=M5RUK5_9BACT|nr:hypothetical protein RMSM_03994 [Rhodopirellula maiorica SM1]